MRVVFPELDGVRCETAAGARKVVPNTDVQLAKVTDSHCACGPTNTLPNPDECFCPQ